MVSAKPEEFETEFDEFLQPEGVRVVEVSVSRGRGRAVMKVTIERLGGVTVGDCAAISRILSDWMEEHEPFSGSYVLEVSSPGLGRLLKRSRDYEIFTGRQVMVTLKESDGSLHEMSGVLKGMQEEELLIAGMEGELHRFPLSRVVKTTLE